MNDLNDPRDTPEYCRRSRCYATRELSADGYCPDHEHDRGFRVRHVDTAAWFSAHDLADVTHILESSPVPEKLRVEVWIRGAWRDIDAAVAAEDQPGAAA